MKGNNRLVRAINLPSDIAYSACTITVHGNKEAFIENFESIIEFDSEIVKIKTKKEIIMINGSKLSIEYFNDEEIKLTGVISKVEII